MENCWYYNGKCLYSPPDGYFGYVYRIINLKDNRIYIGKKQFTFSVKKKITKKVKKETGTRKRTERVQKDSGWLKYFGSSRELLQDVKTLGVENFRREIICFCNSKQELSYYELYWQIQENVMFKPSYNGWIKCTIYKHLLNK